MSKPREFKAISLPVLEENAAGMVRSAGGFCSTRDAVSEEELTALAELKRLHAQARELKERLPGAAAAEREALEARLEALRQEGALWRRRKEEATAAKHARLGHVVLTLDG